MSTNTSSSGAVARRYATALIETGIDAKALESIEKDMADICAMTCGSDDLKDLLFSPLYSREDQKKALAALADKAKFNALTTNFLLLLADNRRLAALPAIYERFCDELSTRRGEVKAQVQTAFALSDAQAKEVQKSLSAALGQDVALDVQTNADLIGGMVVTVGSKMIDDSVKRKLERLKQAMKSGGANQNTSMNKAS